MAGLSGPQLAQALSRGLQKSGINVVDVGMVATPMLYFAAHELCGYSGVMVTGSHNPPQYNGLKMVLGGETLRGGIHPGISSAHGKQGSGSWPRGLSRTGYCRNLLPARCR